MTTEIGAKRVDTRASIGIYTERATPIEGQELANRGDISLLNHAYS